MSRYFATILIRPHTQRGDGLAEFALIMPVLLLILLAVLDLGRAVYAYSVIANCAREGARYGTLSPTDQPGITAAATGRAVGLDLAQLTVTITYPTADSIRVSVSYTFHLLTPLLAQVLGRGALALRSTATMYNGY